MQTQDSNSSSSNGNVLLYRVQRLEGDLRSLEEKIEALAETLQGISIKVTQLCDADKQFSKSFSIMMKVGIGVAVVVLGTALLNALSG